MIQPIQNMKMNRRLPSITFIFSVLLFFCSISTAQTLDPLAGEKAARTCAPCHGNTGIAPNPAFPHLAGQPTQYLMQQLLDYQQGKRQNAVMQEAVKNLSPADIANLAYFYSRQYLPQGSTDKSFIAQGQSLYLGGEINRHIPACSICHGITGEGNIESHIPALQGQSSIYILQQLYAFRTKQRHNDRNQMMQTIAERLTEEEMKAIANYVSGILELQLFFY